MDELEQLGQELASDPSIKAALTEHERACQDEDEANCVVCRTNDALASLAFVIHSLNNQNCDCESCAIADVDELDIAQAIVSDLPSALQLISLCQNGIKLLSEIANATTFVIAHNELEDDEDDEDEPLS